MAGGKSGMIDAERAEKDDRVVDVVAASEIIERYEDNRIRDMGSTVSGKVSSADVRRTKRVEPLVGAMAAFGAAATTTVAG